MSLLDNIIIDLDFVNGELFTASRLPNAQNKKDWLDKGDWLKSAALAGAKNVFFVKNNPTAVFAHCNKTIEAKIDAFNKLWCLSRPRILFLESDGEIFVIDLARAPISKRNNNLEKDFGNLILLNATKETLQELQDFNREQIESGKVFEDERFGGLNTRADQALIADLRIVRGALIATKLPVPYVHNLIGRSIFIRYLEDRKIITDDYFTKIAQKKSVWKQLLNSPAPEEQIDFSDIHSKYVRVLQDKDFTYELFRALSHDFNGDTFPNIDSEEKKVNDKHLKQLRDMLYGNTSPQLFFYSYRFDIIPLDLISAIYEEFYQNTSITKNIKIANVKKSRSRQEGAFYTPPVLAEFVLSRVLDEDAIKRKPRILDPACGSGIFLVEAFRRIVRYSLGRGKKLTFTGLKEIIGNQLVGIEINDDAARIAAFSLYLALLNYLDPPSILEYIGKGERLPNLIVSDEKTKNYFNNIHVNNAFNLNSQTIGKVDIVVGNPPWGAPGRNVTDDVKENHKIMLAWCKNQSYEIGDKDPSQAFLLFATEMLVKNGQCAMLVLASSLLNLGDKAILFRQKLMSQVCLTEVYNFAHVRKFFFNGAIAPFILIHFQKRNQDHTPVEYWSPKRIKSIENTQAVLLSKYDRAYLVNQDLTDNRTWKINWFGRYADSVFLSQLDKRNKLISLIDMENSGRGYEIRTQDYDFPEVSKLPSLILSTFSKYGALSFEEAPKKFTRSGLETVYHGDRILVKRGISTDNQDKVVARFENTGFCFTNSIYGIKLLKNNKDIYLVVLGILWSSLSKYFCFNVSAQWGIWHDEVYLEKELLQLPLPDELLVESAKHVIELVAKLRSYSPENQDLLGPDGIIPKNKIIKQRRIWEKELDEAVFDLYCFTERQRDLIRDCSAVTLPFFYDPYNSIGVKPVMEQGNTDWVKDYAARFAACWRPYLEPDETLRADLCIDLLDNVVAIEFFIADIADEWDLSPKKKLWQKILSEIANVSFQPMGTSQILLEGIIQIVTENTIIIIKRNEKRLWTKSMAYEDAESAITKRILSESTQTGSSK